MSSNRKWKVGCWPRFVGLLAFLVLVVFQTFAQTQPKQDCSAVEILCPDSISAGGRLDCRATVNSKEFTYHWTTSAGNIDSGSDSAAVTISNLPAGQGVTIMLETKGTGPGCPHVATKDTIVTDAELLDRYDHNSPKEAIDQALDKVVAALTRNPQLIAYIVVSPGGGITASINSPSHLSPSNQTVNLFKTLPTLERTSELFVLATFQQHSQREAAQRLNREVDDPLLEARRFAEYARTYVIGRGVAPDRLRVQFGPARKILTVELYVGKRDGNLPSLYHPRTILGNSVSPAMQIEKRWNLVEENVCKDNFGRGVSRSFYCIEVELANETLNHYHIRGLAFTAPGAMPPNLSPIPIAPYAMVRDVIKPSPFRSIWQLLFLADRSSSYLRALEDSAFRNDAVTRTTFLPENSSVRAFVFVQKRLLNLGVKEQKDRQLVFRALGDVVIDGDFYTPSP